MITNDLISGITIGSGETAVNYDFCEHIPAKLKGRVWYDINNDGFQQDGENGISGTTIQLFDLGGNLIAETVTDADGNYCFEDLIAGEYKIREVQPDGYVDGMERIGRINGVRNGVHSANDEFCEIVIRGGEEGVEYNFGEIRLASIEGFVHLDPNGDCVFDVIGGDQPLSGVTMQLLDADGSVMAETVTDAEGHYAFGELLPGEYSVRQVQPGDLFSTGESVGSGGGDAAENIITNINVVSGQNVVNYNFCEQEAAEIHGRVWGRWPSLPE